MNLRFWTWHRNHNFLSEMRGINWLGNFILCNLLEYRDIVKDEPVFDWVWTSDDEHVPYRDYRQVGTRKSLYLRRFYLKRRAPYKCFIHYIARSDNDRHMHDHPWDFTSLCLWGGYDEQVPIDGMYETWSTKPDGSRVRLTEYLHFQKWRKFRPGMILRNKAEHTHKVSLRTNRRGQEKPCWTIVSLTEGRRVWGFHTEDGWVPWYTYLNEHPESPYEEDNYTAST